MSDLDLQAETPSWGEEVERHRIAVHEAGHGAMLVRHGETIESLSIDERHDYGAHAKGDGSSDKFLQAVTILAAGRMALQVNYPDNKPAFWIRGADSDDAYLQAAVEDFWEHQRALGESMVRKAIQDLNDEANRIYPQGGDHLVDEPSMSTEELFTLPTDARLLHLSFFVANTLTKSLLMSPGMKGAVELAAQELEASGTIADTADLSKKLLSLIRAD